MSSGWATLLILLCMLTLVLAVSWLFQIYVDTAAIKIANKLDELWFRELPTEKQDEDSIKEIEKVEMSRSSRYKTRCCNVLTFLKGYRFI